MDDPKMQMASYEVSPEDHPVEVIDNFVKNGQTMELIVYMQNEENIALIKEFAWDMVPKICSYLTEENLTKSPNVISACETALKSLADCANPKELLLSLLEQADAFKDNVKFKILLPPLQTCLLRLPSKRGHSLAIALETLMGHIEALPIPEDRELEGKERLLLANDERVVTITDALMPMLDFLGPFVDEVYFADFSNDPGKDLLKQKTEIIKFCLRLLGNPLVYLDLAVSHVVKKNEDKETKEGEFDTNNTGTKETVIKSVNRNCAEKAMAVISKLQGNPVSLLESITLDNFRIELECKRIKNKEKQGNGDVMEEDDGILLEEPISEEALGTFAYLVFSEHLGRSLMPEIYTHIFLFEVCFPYSSRLLKNTYSLIALKGVKLLLAVVTSLQPCCLSTDLLESDTTQDLLQSLMAVMTRAHLRELRQTAAQVVPLLLKGFNTRGRYLFLNYMLKKSVGNWGVRGLTVSLLKDEIDANLKQSTPNELFTGSHLERLMKVVYALPQGAETDLLECSDHIMPALNLLRYLALRDNPTNNVTGIWNYLSQIKSTYLEDLRTALNMSRAHYELEVKHIKENKGAPSGVDANFHVGGTPMPNLSTRQQTQAMEMALSTFDMMESVVVRVSELLDQAKSATNA